MMIARRIGALFKNSSVIPKQRRRVLFSWFSTANPRQSYFFRDGFEEEKGVSAIYQQALKFQRPNTMRWQQQLVNAVNFIGSVDRPVQKLPFKHDRSDVGAYTVLRVKNSGDTNHTFSILLQMRDDLAKMCIENLKPNDVIHVSGSLAGYVKNYQSGDRQYLYKVVVKEVNHIAQRAQGSTIRSFVESQSEDSGESRLERYNDRLRLWQVFFTSPYEWWDNRKCKTNPQQPDFKHKDTGESLWLSPTDPPWIKRQLQLISSEMAERSKVEVGTSSRVSRWVYD
ncbi:protein OSB1 mitochondrial-like isoform X1 [Tripterygium wilfordii]|uniref:Protein OSB1 mitochondrial-like isoform X1 n=1 Tax=Tripterygium wilfordii TaxID=458696 RepID=A0A7J7D2Z3_TRIWF|nr:protein OSB1, mitochondrial-like [Tripterygium wilfordii]XP_038716405.1 protein OSB1, mitochondrial-like [Tripterygium wilfordii]XP_038716406.1 protein OSB1, mitochondrial-like [Tripterygium wilfordii]XP_038716407.1 protein OSB1, mitochondrial-like [Tripterygium wilfordii]KAF5740715.1 protein OSB1 mitochondrial-like isoform X1 [Tripterygium wilfordii]